MAATLIEVNNYITDIRSGISDFVQEITIKERLGKKDLFCERQKVILLSAYLDIIVDYFDPFVSSSGATAYNTKNFFDTDEIRDVMQHINAICDTNYMLIL